MNGKDLLFDAAATMAVTFAVAVVVTWAYNLLAHGSGTVDWETAFRLAVILGIVLPLTRMRSLRPGMRRP